MGAIPAPITSSDTPFEEPTAAHEAGAGRGRRIGRWELGAALGRGSLGAVWEASDSEGNRAAVKRIPMVGWTNAVPTLEAALAPLFGYTHRNLVEVIEVLPDGQGVAVVNAFMQGMDVGRMLRQAAETGSPGLPVDVVVPILIGMADGLGALHAVGVVHGDLKPTNVLRAETGAAVSDAAVASVLARSDHWGPEVLGTVGYLDPEALRQGFLDRMSDIYSLGICGYEMLTGRQPFDGRSATAVMQSATEGLAPSLAKLTDMVPPELVEALEACIQPRADYRPLAGEICRVLHGVPTGAQLVIPSFAPAAPPTGADVGQESSPVGSSEGMAGSVEVQGTAPAQDTKAGSTAPRDTAPGDTAPSNTIAGDTGPGDTAPRDGAPSNTTGRAVSRESVAPILPRRSISTGGRGRGEGSGNVRQSGAGGARKATSPVGEHLEERRRVRRPPLVRAAAMVGAPKWSPKSRRTAIVAGGALVAIVTLAFGRSAVSSGGRRAVRKSSPTRVLSAPRNQLSSPPAGSTNPALAGSGAHLDPARKGRRFRSPPSSPAAFWKGGVVDLRLGGTGRPRQVRLLGGGTGQLLLGRWSCSGASNAAVYQPATGLVYYFRSWPSPGHPVRPAGQAASGITGGTARVTTTGGCSKVVVTSPVLRVP